MRLSKGVEIFLFTVLFVIGEVDVLNVSQTKKLVGHGTSYVIRSKENDDAFDDDENIASSGIFTQLNAPDKEDYMEKISDRLNYKRNSDEINSETEILHANTNGSIRDTTISTLYDAKSPNVILDELSPDKIVTNDLGNTLPIFLTEPESTFVVKNRPAILKCKAAHALQVHFKCSGSSHPPPSVHDKHVDPHTGVHLEEVTATISRDLVDEFFGKGPFKCECNARSSLGVVKSQIASVHIAYLKKQFQTIPTSLRVEEGTQAELYCKPPVGYPDPKISWLKNNLPITEDEEDGPLISNTGSLLFKHVTLQDMANYTCCAENVAGKRVSESAVLIVYVDGGWSAWSSWKDCKCPGKQAQGRKRMRSCNNPTPLNGGTQCIGSQIQKSPDCIDCQDDAQFISTDVIESSINKKSRWSAWSDWSICSSECIQIRRRKCIQDNRTTENPNSPQLMWLSARTTHNFGTHVKSNCIGKDIQTAECRGNLCLAEKNDFDWIFFMGLTLGLIVLLAFAISFIWWAKHNNNVNLHYNIARTEYFHELDKKDMRINFSNVNINYDCSHPSNNRIIPNSDSEHDYDVPNLSAASYSQPMDEIVVQNYSDNFAVIMDSGCTRNANAGENYLLNTKCISTQYIDHNGGYLSLYNNEVILYIPEYAIVKNLKKSISLILLNDDCNRVHLPDSLICSAIVYCIPKVCNFTKPVILKIPHCLNEIDFWEVSIYQTLNGSDDTKLVWHKITTVGEETINTPVFVKIEENHVYLMTEQLGGFIIVSKPKLNYQPSMRMKLIAFSQFTPSSANCSLRIYVVKEFPNSRYICTEVENQLGGSYMGESNIFAFHLNNCDLNIIVRSSHLDGIDACGHVYEHTIPYNHILSNNSVLHCEFAIKMDRNTLEDFKFNVDFVQCGGDVHHSFSISDEDAHLHTTEAIFEGKATVSIDREGNYCNDINEEHLNQIPQATKRLICASLDPPRSDERDWRLLAKILNTDRYLAYFATKTSPTEQILNMWECQSIEMPNKLVQLMLIFKEMNRKDVMDIISETIGPLWI